MLYLFTSILFTSSLYVLFKLFPRYKVNSFVAIVFNYITCGLVGTQFYQKPLYDYLLEISLMLFLLSIITGIFFILVFYAQNLATRQLGVAGGTVVSRMSLVIPASYSIIMLGERLSLTKVLGILLALAAIYFTVYAGEKKDKQNEKEEEDAKENTAEKEKLGGKKNKKITWLIPLLAFLGVGLTDTLLNISRSYFIEGKPDFIYTDFLFASAAITGIFILSAQKAPVKTVFKPQNVLWGILLGLLNYFSLYFFIKALASNQLEFSKLFPINSVGIVLVSTLASILFFREKMTWRRLLGIGMAIAAILLLVWQQNG
jgi:drug/metabolite transporter (DMT)-like permease